MPPMKHTQFCFSMNKRNQYSQQNFNFKFLTLSIQYNEYIIPKLQNYNCEINQGFLESIFHFKKTKIFILKLFKESFVPQLEKSP